MFTIIGQCFFFFFVVVVHTYSTSACLVLLSCVYFYTRVFLFLLLLLLSLAFARAATILLQRIGKRMNYIIHYFGPKTTRNGRVVFLYTRNTVFTIAPVNDLKRLIPGEWYLVRPYPPRLSTRERKRPENSHQKIRIILDHLTATA
jgi:hypothetical protein